MDLNPTYLCAFTQTIDKISYLTIVFTNANTVIFNTKKRRYSFSYDVCSRQILLMIASLATIGFTETQVYDRSLIQMKNFSSQFEKIIFVKNVHNIIEKHKLKILKI